MCKQIIHLSAIVLEFFKVRRLTKVFLFIVLLDVLLFKDGELLYPIVLISPVLVALRPLLGNVAVRDSGKPFDRLPYLKYKYTVGLYTL